MYVDNIYIQKEAYYSTANEFSIFNFWDINIASDTQYNTLNADLVNSPALPFPPD